MASPHRVLQLVRAAFGAIVACSLAASWPAAAGELALAGAQMRTFPDLYSVDGVVQAVRQSTVAAQVSGRILDIAVDAGSTVRRGQVIARIDEREAVDVLAAARAQTAAAAAVAENARATLDRTRTLYERGFVSAAALDKAQADYRSAQAQLGVARAGAGQAATTRSYAQITAPMDGVVAARLAEAGDMAAPGRAIAAVYDPTALRVEIAVPQSLMPQIDLRGAVDVELADGSIAVGRNAMIVPVADTRSHTTRIRFDLLSSGAGAHITAVPGQYARVQLVTARTDRLVIPAAAVVRRSELTAVYLIGPDGVPDLRQVRAGDTLPGGFVEILSGLAAGDRVALDPTRATELARLAARH